MNKNQKPLMLAYILFLLISVFYYMASRIWNFEFSTWERIVVATTIASYSFALASMPKYMYKLNKRHIDLLTEYLLLAKKLHEKEEETFPEGADKDFVLSNGKDIIDKTATLILKKEKSCKKCESLSFLLDASGFLLFFCVFGFEFIFNIFVQVQEIWTLWAFIIILIVDYLEAMQANKYEEIYTVLIKSTKDTLIKLEGKQNG